MNVKFKVWDLADKRWRYEPYFISNDGFLYTVEPQTGQIVQLIDNRFIPVYFTGKYDETATELFDGDIVISAAGDVREVFIEKGDVYVKNKDDADFLAYRNHYKIIGNKFENIELGGK